ncbi:GA module-containing protein [Streptococcus dysgalactiae]|uniref:GA module-containing protein n=1 Tax=Streptococcus dysgalactiae TaxID=1334 RepID=UPI001C9D7E57|nr:GA module-containing protein [Streptococcus dysgalactiae]QZT27845.1 GA module-containing protein [Streptococcus dysgalactiae]
MNYKKQTSRDNINVLDYLTDKEKAYFERTIDNSYDEEAISRIVEQAVAASNQKGNLILKYDSLVRSGQYSDMPDERNVISSYELEDIKCIVNRLESRV